MTTYLLILIISGIAMTALGSLVYLRNQKSAMSRYFLLACLSVAFWTLAHYYVDHSPNLSIALLSAQAAATAAFSVVYWMAFFAIHFGRVQSRVSISKIILLYLVGAGFSLSPLVYVSASQGENIVNVDTGLGYVVYLAALVGLLGFTIWKLFNVRKSANGVERKQLNFILWAIAITFGIAIINNAVIPLFITDWKAVKYTSLLAVFFVSLVSYAIIRHRLFDIKFVIARALAYTLLVSILMSVYTLAVFAVSGMLFRGNVSQEQVVVYSGLAIFTAATFERLKNWLIRATDHIFYKSQYDSELLLSRLTHLMASTLDLEILTSKILEEMLKTMHIGHGLFIVFGKDMQFEATVSSDDRHYAHISKQLVQKLAKFTEATIYDEVENEADRLLMKQVGAMMILPLYSSAELQGILILGDKKSGEMYAEKDMKLMEILGPELAVAIDNARSYKQISEFNETLEHEVESATKDLKLANEKLSRSNEKLRQLDKLKDEFISVTSHELRTPLTAIRSYLWMAQNGKNKDDKFEEYMDRAYVSTERLINMVNDTLDVSRIESGRMELMIEPIDLNKLAQEVLDGVSSRATQRHQQLILKKTRSLPLVECDPAKIFQVLTNLVGNALKFTPDGGKIVIDFSQRGDTVTVRVKDNGPGISAEDQARLFQKFSRLESATSIPGTGLGLYLSQQIIKLSKGKIWVESKSGSGAAFLFSLPVSKIQTTNNTPRPRQFRSIGA